MDICSNCVVNTHWSHRTFLSFLILSGSPWWTRTNRTTRNASKNKTSQLKQRKSQPWRRFGYPVSAWILTILLLPLLRSFCFDWEDKSNTRDSVSSTIQTPQTSSKLSNVSRISNSLLGVWISRWNTVYRLWYITSLVAHSFYNSCLPQNLR